MVVGQANPDGFSVGPGRARPRRTRRPRPVEIPSAPTLPDLPAELPPDDLYPPEDWGEELARAVRESQRKLGVLEDGS